jgi:hypothetical protein
MSQVADPRIQDLARKIQSRTHEIGVASPLGAQQLAQEYARLQRTLLDVAKNPDAAPLLEAHVAQIKAIRDEMMGADRTSLSPTRKQVKLDRNIAWVEIKIEEIVAIDDPLEQSVAAAAFLRKMRFSRSNARQVRIGDDQPTMRAVTPSDALTSAEKKLFREARRGQPAQASGTRAASE